MTYEGRKEVHFRFLKLGRESPYAEEFKDQKQEKPVEKKEKTDSKEKK